MRINSPGQASTRVVNHVLTLAAVVGWRSDGGTVPSASVYQNKTGVFGFFAERSGDVSEKKNLSALRTGGALASFS